MHRRCRPLLCTVLHRHLGARAQAAPAPRCRRGVWHLGSRCCIVCGLGGHVRGCETTTDASTHTQWWSKTIATQGHELGSSHNSCELNVNSSDSLLGLVCSLGSGRAWGGLGGGRGGRRACVHFKKEDFPFSLGKFPGNLRGFSSNKGPEISYQSAGISELGQGRA